MYFSLDIVSILPSLPRKYWAVIIFIKIIMSIIIIIHYYYKQFQS